MRMSSLKAINIFNAGKMLLFSIPGLLARRLFGDIWLITERPDQARDNGFIFFKYMKRNHPGHKIYYVIKKKSDDHKKINEYGSIVDFNSWKHYLLFCWSSVHISSHINGCVPERNPFVKHLKKYLGYKDVFIPHGVSYGIAEFCLARYAKLDLFICSGKNEFDNVLENYGYDSDKVVLTGFPRLDEWHKADVNYNQILIMPTWRAYIAQQPEISFEQTLFYKSYSELLNNVRLDKYLRDQNLFVFFCLHHEMKKYTDFFSSDCPRIKFINQDYYDIQKLLKESALLITDYSSVSFDFAYMNKPVLYFQFDQKEFMQKQYQKGNFDFERDGFGPIAYDEMTLVENIIKTSESGFKFDDEYLKRMLNFYVLRDEHNCERVYIEIDKRWPLHKTG